MPRHTSDIYKNDIGSRIVVHFINRDGEDYPVNTASIMRLKLTGPDGTEKTFALTFATSPFGNGTGTDGWVEYITTSLSDLPVAGRWEGQAYVEFSVSDKRHSQPCFIHVGEIPSF